MPTPAIMSKGSDAKGKGKMKGWLMAMMASWKGKSKGSDGWGEGLPAASPEAPKGKSKGSDGLPAASPEAPKGKSKGSDGLPAAYPEAPKGKSKGSDGVKGDGLRTDGQGPKGKPKGYVEGDGLPAADQEAKEKPKGSDGVEGKESPTLPYERLIKLPPTGKVADLPPPPKEGSEPTNQEINWILNHFQTMDDEELSSLLEDARKHPLLQRYVAENLELGPTLKQAKETYDYDFGDHDPAEELAGFDMFILEVLRREHPRIDPWADPSPATPPTATAPDSLPAKGNPAHGGKGKGKVETNGDDRDCLEPCILLSVCFLGKDLHSGFWKIHLHMFTGDLMSPLIKDLAPIGEHERPPTLASGFGNDQPDPFKTSKQQLDDHINIIMGWFRRCNSKDMMKQVHHARDNPQFKEFQDSLSHKFGDDAFNDLVNFDIWLMKKCIGASMPSPAPPASAAVESARAEPTPAEPAASNEIPALDRNQVAQYKNYWKQFKGVTPSSPKVPDTSIPSPTSSPGMSTSGSGSTSVVETPKAKKTDGEGLGFGIVVLGL